MRAPTSALRIAAAAMIIALCFVVSLLPTIPGSMLKFGGLPLLIGSLLIGPRTGFAVGCITDVLGFLFRPQGTFFPGFTLTQALTASLPGLFSLNRDPFSWTSTKTESPQAETSLLKCYLRLLLIFAITQALTSVLMVSYFTSTFVAGTPLIFELWHRSFTQSIHVPVYAALATLFLSAFRKNELYERLLQVRL